MFIWLLCILCWTMSDSEMRSVFSFCIYSLPTFLFLPTLSSLAPPHSQRLFAILFTALPLFSDISLLLKSFLLLLLILPPQKYLFTTPSTSRHSTNPCSTLTLKTCKSKEARTVLWWCFCCPISTALLPKLSLKASAVQPNPPDVNLYFIVHNHCWLARRTYFIISFAVPTLCSKWRSRDTCIGPTPTARLLNCSGTCIKLGFTPRPLKGRSSAHPSAKSPQSVSTRHSIEGWDCSLGE